MKNCLIMGSGRSGTSMVAGMLYDAGYYMGEDLYPPRHSNPKGFFENAEINGINERILEKYGRKISHFLFKRTKNNTIYRPGYGQRWLLSLPVRKNVKFFDRDIEMRIKRALSRNPFAYKDPRFCYTLQVWENFLKPAVVYICIFREPHATVESILKECRSVDYLKNFTINKRNAYNVWINMYSHILVKQLKSINRFVFVHYNQVYDGSALKRLSGYLGVSLSLDFVDKGLKRSTGNPGEEIPLKAQQIYAELCRMAGYK